jgi:hypothetical protein
VRPRRKLQAAKYLLQCPAIKGFMYWSWGLWCCTWALGSRQADGGKQCRGEQQSCYMPWARQTNTGVQEG